MRIAVIGAGSVGGTLGRRWAQAGYDVVFGVREDGDVKGGLPDGARALPVQQAARGAEVVVLAVPFAAVPDALASAAPLDGTIMIDATNPVGRDPSGRLVVDASHGHPSGGERVAALAPGARVVKTLNTVGYNIMAAPELNGARAVMPIAGDDAGANATARELVAALGFEPLDAGPLLRARELEHWAILWISLASGGMGREFAFALHRRDGGSG